MFRWRKHIRSLSRLACTYQTVVSRWNRRGLCVHAGDERRQRLHELDAANRQPFTPVQMCVLRMMNGGWDLRVACADSETLTAALVRPSAAGKVERRPICYDVLYFLRAQDAIATRADWIEKQAWYCEYQLTTLGRKIAAGE